MNHRLSVILLISALFLFFLPFINNPPLLLNRNNDLAWFSQNYAFFKDQILTFHHLPLWQNQILSGSPYLGDPQNPLLYLPNYLSLVLPLPIFFLIFFAMHLLIAAFGTFHLARKLKFPVLASLFCAIVYAFSPVMSGHLEAGHLNLIAALAWFPLFLSVIYGLVTELKFSYIFLVGFTGAAIFLNYLTIFFYALVAGIILVAWKFPGSKRNRAILLLLAAISVFALICLPQIIISLSYLPLTTRNLISPADIYPLFPSLKDFFISILSPYSYGLNKLGAETVLTAGILPEILAVLGFLYIGPKNKLSIILYFSLAVWLALNLRMLGYLFLLKIFPFLLFFRIATRFWFITILIVALLGGHLLKRVRPRYQLLVCFLAILELSYFNWQNFSSKPLIPPVNTGFEELLQPILSQPQYFRIYCTTGCPQVYLSNKGTASGYNPIQMTNHYNYITRAAGYGYNLYTVALPVYQSFPDKPQPESIGLGLLGVKYIFTPYLLTDPNFTLVSSKNNFFLYQNTNALPRAFTIDNNQIRPLKLTKDLPGDLEVSLDPNVTRVIINEPYMPLWYALDQNRKSLPVSSYNQILLSIPVRKATKLTVSFTPPWVRTLVAISLLSSLAGLVYISKSLFR